MEWRHRVEPGPHHPRIEGVARGEKCPVAAKAARSINGGGDPANRLRLAIHIGEQRARAVDEITRQDDQHARLGLEHSSASITYITYISDINYPGPASVILVDSRHPDGFLLASPGRASSAPRS